MIMEPNMCQCHLINWHTFPNYQYVTGENYDFKSKIDCQSKVNAQEMKYLDYLNICQYIPGKENTKFPDEIYQRILIHTQNNETYSPKVKRMKLK